MTPQLVEKEVFVMMKALEEEAAVSYWWPVGARTDRQHELIIDRLPPLPARCVATSPAAQAPPLLQR